MNTKQAKLTIFYRDEIGTVAQVCEHIIFGAGFNGDEVMVIIDDENDIRVKPENILEIIAVNEDEAESMLNDLISNES